MYACSHPLIKSLIICIWYSERDYNSQSSDIYQSLCPGKWIKLGHSMSDHMPINYWLHHIQIKFNLIIMAGTKKQKSVGDLFHTIAIYTSNNCLN